MATIFAAFGKTLGNNKGSIQNFGIVGVTIATEEISKFIFFYCPCDYPRNQTYGSVFIWGPAAVLLIAGYLAHRRTWRLTTGLCNRTPSQAVRRGTKRIIHFCFIFSSIGIKAMIAPATWVVLAFLKGDYYACAHWPDPLNDVAISRRYYQLDELNGNISLPKPCLFNPNPAKFKGSDEAEVIARSLRAESHIIGWFYLTLGLLLAVVVMLCMRCQSNFSYEQSNYIERYRKHEIELFEDKLDEKAKEQAQRIVDGYFSKTRAKEDWDRIAVINDKVTKSKRGKAIYSPLHRFVNKEKLREEGFLENDLVNDVAEPKHLMHKPKTKKKSSNTSTRAGGGGDASVPATQFIPMVPPTQKVIVKPTVPVASAEEPKAPKPVPGSTKPETASSADPQSTQQSTDKSMESSPPYEATSMAQLTPAAVQDPSTSPLDVASEPSVASVPTPTHPALIRPAASQHPRKDRPLSLPPSKTDAQSAAAETSSVKETSLGDFGGYYSREDLRRSLESVDGPDPTRINEQIDSSEADTPDQKEEEEEPYFPLLENADEAPLLTEEA